MSKARSPREVCSITIGIRGLMQAPSGRGSTVSYRESPFPSPVSTAARGHVRARAGSASPPRRADRRPRAGEGPRESSRGSERRAPARPSPPPHPRSEEHTSELQSHHDLVCRLLLEKKKKK